MSISTFNGFSYNLDIKRRTMDIILAKIREVLTPEYIKSLITENGNTQVAERKYIVKIKEILNGLGYTFEEAGSQSCKDFRNINNIGINIEMKKTDSFNIICNDTCPNDEIDYVIIFTGKEYVNQANIEPQIVHINGGDIVNMSPWHTECKEDLNNGKNKWCRGENKKNLPGILRVYWRPSWQFDIRSLLVTQ